MFWVAILFAAASVSAAAPAPLTVDQIDFSQGYADLLEINTAVFSLAVIIYSFRKVLQLLNMGSKV